MTPNRRHLSDREVQRRWLDPRLASVRVADVCAYLLSRQWKQVPSDDSHTLLFQEPSGPDGPLFQWLPVTENRRDYLQQLYELLAGIAEQEDRDAGSVLSDILGLAGKSGRNGPAGLVEMAKSE